MSRRFSYSQKRYESACFLEQSTYLFDLNGRKLGKLGTYKCRTEKKKFFFANYFVSDVKAKLPFSFSSRLKITILKMSDNAMRNLWCTILKL